MGRAEMSAGQGPDAGRQEARYRSVDQIDPVELRGRVSRWVEEHPGGTEEELIGDLSSQYAEYHRGELAIVLRAALFTEKRKRRP